LLFLNKPYNKQKNVSKKYRNNQPLINKYLFFHINLRNLIISLIYSICFNLIILKIFIDYYCNIEMEKKKK